MVQNVSPCNGEPFGVSHCGRMVSLAFLAVPEGAFRGWSKKPLLECPCTCTKARRVPLGVVKKASSYGGKGAFEVEDGLDNGCCGGVRRFDKAGCVRMPSYGGVRDVPKPVGCLWGWSKKPLLTDEVEDGLDEQSQWMLGHLGQIGKNLTWAKLETRPNLMTSGRKKRNDPKMQNVNDPGDWQRR